jgi:hypothetical protein
MEDILQEERFNFIAGADREFILAFNAELHRLGYDFGGKIGSGFNWGKYMLIYTKPGAKSKNGYARLYIREASVALRLFLDEIDKHRDFIEKSPNHIQEVFTGSYGDCTHCRSEKGGTCKFRKTYTINERRMDKCDSLTFEFREPSVEKLGDYLALFTEFYPVKASQN